MSTYQSWHACYLSWCLGMTRSLNTEIGIADEFSCRISGCHRDMPRHPRVHTNIHVAMEDRRCNHSILASAGFARTGPARGPRRAPDSHIEANVTHLRSKIAPIRLEALANCRFLDCFWDLPDDNWSHRNNESDTPPSMATCIVHQSTHHTTARDDGMANWMNCSFDYSWLQLLGCGALPHSCWWCPYKLRWWLRSFRLLIVAN